MQGIQRMPQIVMLPVARLLTPSWLLKTTAFFLTLTMLFAGCKPSADKNDPGPLPSKKSDGTFSTSSVALPGGRAYYAVSYMGGSVSPYTNGWCRISQYTFTAGTGSTGTVSSKTQYWNQNFTGDHTVWKVSSTFPTVCGNNCGFVKCPKGAEPGALAGWSTVTGTYTLDVPNSRVTITWPGWGPNNTETWTMTNPTGSNVRGDAKAYTKLDFYSSNYGIQHGSGFGSNTDFSGASSVDLAEMKGLGYNLNDVYVWQNPYLGPDEETVYPNTYFAWFDRQICSTGVYRRTLAGTPCSSCYPSAGAGGDTKDYVASSSIGSQGRITYWQHEIGAHMCKESCTSNCISSGGGHTKVMYQVIDDNGKFHGFVGVEASLGYFANRGRFVGNFHMLFL